MRILGRSLFILSLLFCLTSAAKLHSIFPRCKISDQQCLKDAVQKSLPNLRGGLPEWNVPALDPLFIPEMTIGGGQNVVQLTQKYKNAELYGASVIKITDFSLDLDKKMMYMKFTFPQWVMNATYEVSGKILLIPVYGTGSCSLVLEQGEGTQVFDLEKYTKKSQTFLKVTGGKLDIDIQKATYKFDNLFNGDKLLGDNINKVINENWEDVYLEVRNGYGEVYTATFMNIANKILTKIPISELFVN